MRFGNHRFSVLSAHTVTAANGANESSPGDLLRILQEQAGLDLVTLRPADGGESRNTFWVTDRAGTISVLKVMPREPVDAVAEEFGLSRDEVEDAIRVATRAAA